MINTDKFIKTKTQTAPLSLTLRIISNTILINLMVEIADSKYNLKLLIFKVLVFATAMRYGIIRCLNAL